MFRIHKEGYTTLLIAGFTSIIIVALSYLYLYELYIYIAVILLLLFFFILNFFRNPRRNIPQNLADADIVVAPADGKVVAIEKVSDDEFKEGEWIQVSIFMSPLNVHVNRHPVSGTVENVAYHPGKYLVAWHPKSSTENERTTLLYNSHNRFIKLRQIAGAVARRIVYYTKDGDEVLKGSELGFIKFGSRVDILLPPDSEIKVSVDEHVKGNLNCIARLQ